MERPDTAGVSQASDKEQPSGNAQVNSDPQQKETPTLDPVATQGISDEKQRIADEKQRRAQEKQRLVNEERKRALHPQTGTESEQLWATAVKKDDTVELLDLELAWNELGDAISISVPHNEPEVTGDSVDQRNAALIAREIRRYIIATCSNEQSKRKLVGDQPNSDGKGDDEKENDVEEAEWLAPIPDMAETIALEEEDDEDDGTLKSVYGSSILLKLQWEYRAPKKEVPEMDYAELAFFISDISINLTDSFDKNPSAAQLVLDLIALDMGPLLMARYITAIEIEHTTLAESTFSLLKLCATTANPKEMHIAIKTFLSKIDAVYTEATSYLCLHPLIELWAEVIPRVKTKRKPLLTDMIRHVERMLASAETYEANFVPDEGIGVERPGRLSRIPDLLLDFYEKLVSAQQRQVEDATHIRVQFDYLGRPKPVVDELLSDVDANAADGQEFEGQVAGDSSQEGTGHGCEKSEEKKEERGPTAHEAPAERSGFEIKAAAVATKENSAEWVRERAVTLANVLLLFGMLWMRLPAPAGEVQNVPKRKRKRNTKKEGVVPLKEKEESIQRCLKLFPILGWPNLVLVCQIATDGMSLIHAGRAGELMKEHLGHEVLSKKDMKHTTYSLNSVGFYISGALRQVTMTTDEHEKEDFATETNDLASTAFHSLDPSYAFDLVLPFLLPTIGHSNKGVSVRGIITVGAFLRALPEKAFRTLDDLLRLRSGTGSGGRDVNVLGLLLGLSRALPALDDPEHRRTAYEAIQTILRKCESPVARYVMTECLYYNAGSSVISSQFMTELKDAVMYSDSIASPSRKDGWSRMQASRIRWRFAYDCFGRNFLPRKELLSFRDQLSTASSLIYFLIGRDKAILKEIGESDVELSEEILRRQRFCIAYGMLGRDCIRALASVAEHDRKNIPSSELARKNKTNAVALYHVSGLTLNQCVTAISFIESALDSI